MLTPEMRGFLKLLAGLLVLLAFLGLMFWPYVVMWVSETLGV